MSDAPVFVVGDWRVADGIYPDTLIWENCSEDGAEVRNVGFARSHDEARKIVAFHNAALTQKDSA